MGTGSTVSKSKHKSCFPKHRQAMFAKYDRDKDNVLSQAEAGVESCFRAVLLRMIQHRAVTQVVTYAKKEMSVNVDKAN